MNLDEKQSARARKNVNAWMAAACCVVALAMVAAMCAVAPAEALASQDLSLSTSASSTLTIGKAKSVKAKGGAEKITVTFKKGANAAKSQVAYKKAGSKKWIVKNVGSKTKVVLKKLKGNKKYYVRVRCYTKSGSVATYGNWSAAKKVSVKINSKLIGKWQLVEASAEGLDKETLSQAKAMGLTYVLTVKGNEKAYGSFKNDSGYDLDTSKGKMNLSWKKKTTSKSVFISDGEDGSVNGVVSGSTLTLKDDAGWMKFKKI